MSEEEPFEPVWLVSPTGDTLTLAKTQARSLYLRSVGWRLVPAPDIPVNRVPLEAGQVRRAPTGELVSVLWVDALDFAAIVQVGTSAYIWDSGTWWTPALLRRVPEPLRGKSPIAAKIMESWEVVS